MENDLHVKFPHLMFLLKLLEAGKQKDQEM